MKYSICVNQAAVIENNWSKITMEHCAVLEAVSLLCVTPQSKKISDESGQWTEIKIDDVKELLPIIRKSELEFIGIINELCLVKLLEEKPNRNSLVYLKLRAGDNFDKYIGDSGMEESIELQNKKSKK